MSLNLPRSIRSSLFLPLMLLAAASTARAQCYRFSGGGATLQIDITSIVVQSGPITNPQGGIFTDVAFSSNNTFRFGGVTLTSQAMEDGVGLITYSAAVGNNPDYTSIKLSVPTNQPDTVTAAYSWFFLLEGIGNRIPGGLLPPALTPFSAWVYPDPSQTQIIGVTSGPLGNQTTATFQITSITSCNSGSTVNGKAIGNPIDVPGDCGCGKAPDPVGLGTGNLFEQFTDYRTSGPNPLSLIRYYNSMPSSSTLATTLGAGWRTNYDRYLRISSNSVVAERPDGKEYTFTLNNGNWTTDTDVDAKLSNSGSTWTLTDHDDTIETYAAPGGAQGQLQTIQARNGYAQTLAYDSNNLLLTVTDSYQRQLSFSNTAGFLSSVSTPDNVVSYGVAGTLMTASFSGTPQTEQSYVYGNSSFPNALTSYIDENGSTFLTWTYDSSGRVLTEQLAAGASPVTYAYNDTDGSRTVTNAFGETDLFKFKTLQGAPKLIEIDRSATSSTPAGTRLFTFDSNGYPASSTDWNGNLTTYVNDVHGQPTSVTEASGTPLARTSTITYHPGFHLPTQIVIPGQTTSFTYDGNGEMLTSTQTDTATNAAPRIWTYTWANSLPATVKGPRSDVSQLTTYAYDSSGALVEITDPLGHTVKVTQHSPGGFPQTVIDFNGVTRKRAYDSRQRLISSTVMTAAGPLTTTFSYDKAGNQTGITLPDGSGVTKTYDSAHRLIVESDVVGDNLGYELDALGDRLQVAAVDSSSTLQFRRGGVYDALGRIQQSFGGANQTTSFTYDANSNRISITDALNGTTQKTFDALNRVISRVDPAKGKMTTTYDANSRPLVFTDANGAITSYAYDGFGDPIQYAGARGHDSAQFDAAGNIIQKLDARGVVTNYTYDALNRLTSVSYPGNSAENVTFTYDESGHGFGVGRITSVTDAAGTLSRTYDEQGNLLTENRTLGPAALLTSYTYDKASNLASVTYPSKWTINYTRDKQGRITGVSATAPGGGAAKSVITGASYAPFGPLTGLSYGNGLSESRTFDHDYRAAKVTVTGKSTVQSLTYGYDNDNNVLSVGDGVTAANNQSFTYDPLDRMISASGAYGSLNYSYDANGNRLTDATAASSVDGLGSAGLFTYNQAGRLATVWTKGGQQLTQYTYDAFGERLAKSSATTGSTLYQYDSSGHLLEEADGQGNFHVDYIYLDDRPIAAIQASTNTIYFLHTDSLGTPQIATDGSQAIAWAGGYQPFGAVSSLPVTMVQNLRLPGQEFDQDTGLYFNGFRPYAPGWGRYLQSDPTGLGGGMNTYAYAYGNPLAFDDPLGLVSWGKVYSEVKGAIKGAITEQLVAADIESREGVQQLEHQYGEVVDEAIGVLVSVGAKLAEYGKDVLAGGEVLCPECGIAITILLDVLPDFAYNATHPPEETAGPDVLDDLKALNQQVTSCTASNSQGQLPVFLTPRPSNAPDPYNAVWRAAP